MSPEEICTLLKKTFPEAVTDTVLEATRPYAVVAAPRWPEVARFLRDEPALERGAFVREDLQYSGNSELLAELTATTTDAGRLRVYAGYSGWAPGQLDTELARGGWHVVAGDTELVFSDDPEQLWEKLDPRPAPLSAGRREAPGGSGVVAGAAVMRADDPVHMRHQVGHAAGVFLQDAFDGAAEAGPVLR